MNLEGYIEKYKDDRFYQEVFLQKEYGPAKDFVVIDVGACAGEFSFWMYDTASEIYAIEPYSEHYKELEDNIRDFGFDKVKPFRLALGEKNSKGYYHIEVRGGGRIGEFRDTEVEEVKVKTLATFIKENKIEKVNVLKIDIENGEDAVIKAPDFPEALEKIDMIIGEHLGGYMDYFINKGFKMSQHSPNLVFKKC